jgi:hypothetical protein
MNKDSIVLIFQQELADDIIKLIRTQDWAGEKAKGNIVMQDHINFLNKMRKT